jgi:hypothetical protein
VLSGFRMNEVGIVGVLMKEDKSLIKTLGKSR